MPGEKVANEDGSQLLTSCSIEVVASQKAINSVRKISKEILITRKFFENLRTILDTVRLMRGTPLIKYETVKTCQK